MNINRAEIEDFLLNTLSKESNILLRRSGRVDSDFIAALWEIMLENKQPLAWRSAWVMYHLVYENKELARPYIHKITEQLPHFPFDGQKREMLKVLMLFDVQDLDMGKLVGLCFEMMMSPKESLAVNVHAMQMIFNISEIETELKAELKQAIEFLLPEAKAGMISRGTKLLRKMKDI